VIDERAHIDPSAKIDKDVTIGPWTYIGDNVEIGSGTVIGSHVVIKGNTKIGTDNKIFQFSSIGEISQDKKFKGEDTFLIIGNGNTIRENVTINQGTIGGGGTTKIGDNNWIMANVHIAHDCNIGSNITFANYVGLAGHVTIEDYVTISGYSGVHQFCKIGAYSFIAKASYVTKDILPFLMIAGYEPAACGLNILGLKRNNFSASTIEALRQGYKAIFRKNLTVNQSIEELEKLLPTCSDIQYYIDGLKSSTRGIVR
jgi:UDP-N-acetylglucosamine acyltransferase